MYLFFDPTIKPVLTTNINGVFINVKTSGLSMYGIPDLILKHYVEDYEDLFYSIISMIFKGEFNPLLTWNFNGQIFKFKKDESGFFEIYFEIATTVQIVSILNPITGNPLKFISKGIKDEFGLPEIMISANYLESRGLLAYAIKEIEMGNSIDEYSLIEFDGFQFTIDSDMDRYGEKQFVIRESGKKIITNERRHLKRIK